jgi:cephalosporin hydroxylase
MDRPSAKRAPASPATRAARRLEQPVLSAFVKIARRQQRRGNYTPAMERALAQVLPGLPMTNSKREGRTKSPAVRAVIDRFHTLYYDDRRTWRQTKFLGTTTWKCPFDLWMYQELVYNLRPGLIIETGTAYGGSAMFLGWLCDLVGHGEVVSVDIKPKVDVLPEHPRVTYLTGSSVDPAIVEKVRGMIPEGEPVVVILDSDHKAKHVLRELEAYSGMVTPGSYLIVEDTNINGHPVRLQHGPGPMEALNKFLKTTDAFDIDKTMQRYHLTQNPRGFLRKR